MMYCRHCRRVFGGKWSRIKHEVEEHGKPAPSWLLNQVRAGRLELRIAGSSIGAPAPSREVRDR